MWVPLKWSLELAGRRSGLIDRASRRVVEGAPSLRTLVVLALPLNPSPSQGRSDWPGAKLPMPLERPSLNPTRILLSLLLASFNIFPLVSPSFHFKQPPKTPVFPLDKSPLLDVWCLRPVPAVTVQLHRLRKPSPRCRPWAYVQSNPPLGPVCSMGRPIELPSPHHTCNGHLTRASPLSACI